jgi:hypothetical protein
MLLDMSWSRPLYNIIKFPVSSFYRDLQCISGSLLSDKPSGTTQKGSRSQVYGRVTFRMASESLDNLMQKVASSQPNVPDNWHLQIGDETPSAPPAINTASQLANQQRTVQIIRETQSESTSTSETEDR